MEWPGESLCVLGGSCGGVRWQKEASEPRKAQRMSGMCQILEES